MSLELMKYNLIQSMPWLSTTYHNLLDIYSNKQGHHALLVHSAKGIAEDNLLEALGEYLLCHNTIDNDLPVCGVCSACQLMAAHNHPDWHIIKPEKDKKQVGIDAIRTLTDLLYQHANQGGAKIVQIIELESLTHAAMNALLKILEEPPERTFFLLSTYNSTALLATIKSRCLNYPMKIPSTEMGVAWIKAEVNEKSESTILTALKLAHGAPLQAKKMLVDGSFDERSVFNQAFFDAIENKNYVVLLEWLTKSHASFHFDGMISFILDALKYQLCLDGHSIAKKEEELKDILINQDHLPLIKRLASMETRLLQSVLQQANHLRHQLINNSGLNGELLMVDFLLTWQQKRAFTLPL